MISSVVIVAYRPHPWLAPAVRSAMAQADEVIVVDNGSGGAVAGLLPHGAARVLSLPRNVGFPAGVNAGIDAARGEAVALLNDDAMADPGWLASAVDALSETGTGAVTPKIVFEGLHADVRFDDEPTFVGDDPRPLGRALRSVRAGGDEVLPLLVGPGVHRLEQGEMDGSVGPWRWTTGREPVYVPLPEGAGADDVFVNGERAPVAGIVRLINSAGTYLSRHGFGGDFAFASPDDGSYDTAGERFGGCGAALVTTRETLSRVGRLAGDFFAYYEDLDWSWRVRLAGLRVRYEPAGRVRHVGGATTGGPASEEVQRLAARNRLACLARNAPLPEVAREAHRARQAGANAALAGVPRGLARRPALRRRWTTTPRAVWDRWAGVDERWPASAPS